LHSYATISSMITPFFFFNRSDDHRDLHSFPTRRSSDLRSARRRRIVHAAKPRSTDCIFGRTYSHGRPAFLEAGSRAGARDCGRRDRKSTRLNSSHVEISYAVFCLKKKKRETYIGDSIES